MSEKVTEEEKRLHCRSMKHENVFPPYFFAQTVNLWCDVKNSIAHLPSRTKMTQWPHAQVQWPMCEPVPPISRKPLLRMGHNWNECDTLFAGHALHSVAKKEHPGHYWLPERCIDVYLWRRIQACLRVWYFRCGVSHAFDWFETQFGVKSCQSWVPRFKWMKSEWERRASESRERARAGRFPLDVLQAALLLTSPSVSEWLYQLV